MYGLRGIEKAGICRKVAKVGFGHYREAYPVHGSSGGGDIESGITLESGTLCSLHESLGTFFFIGEGKAVFKGDRKKAEPVVAFSKRGPGRTEGDARCIAFGGISGNSRGGGACKLFGIVSLDGH